MRRRLSSASEGQAKKVVVTDQVARTLGSNPALDQGFVPDDDANVFLTTAESFDQPQASELSSQGVDFDRTADCFAAGEDGFLGVNTRGGPTG